MGKEFQILGKESLTTVAEQLGKEFQSDRAKGHYNLLQHIEQP